MCSTSLWLRWNDEFIASRETAELRAETLQMGYSLGNLLKDLGVGDAAIEGAACLTLYAYAVAPSCRISRSA